jgi:hypothetical protein
MYDVCILKENQKFPSWHFLLRGVRERERKKCVFPKRSDIAISIAFPFERERDGDLGLRLLNK